VFKNRFILATTTIAIVALQVMLWLLIIKSSSLPEEVVLGYTLPPAQRLAPMPNLWWIPAIAGVAWLLNLGIGWRLYRRYPTITKMLATISAVICILAAITLIKTITIYTSLI
jgi:hypothetical protein